MYIGLGHTNLFFVFMLFDTTMGHSLTDDNASFLHLSLLDSPSLGLRFSRGTLDSSETHSSRDGTQQATVSFIFQLLF